MNTKLKQSKKTTKPACSHDTFFKLIFSDPKLAKELLELLFTKSKRAAFNLDDIKIEKDSYKKNLADLMLSFPFKGYSKKRVEFFMIVEHKSFEDKNSYEQILKYLYLIREFILKQTGSVKPVIPALLHHGRKTLNLEKSLQEQDFKEFFSKIPWNQKKHVKL